MFCKNCGEEIQKSWKNCPKCGCELEDKEEGKYVFFPKLKGKTRRNINLAFRIISIIVGIFSAVMVILHICGDVLADENYKWIVYIIRFIYICGPYLIMEHIAGWIDNTMRLQKNPYVKPHSDMINIIAKITCICTEAIVVIAGIMLVAPSVEQEWEIMAAVANDAPYIDYLIIMKGPVILLVFSMVLEGILQTVLEGTFMLGHIVRFYQDVMEPDELQQNGLWLQVQEGYRKYVQASVLEPYCLQSVHDMTYEMDKVYRKTARKCGKKFGRDVDILFAIIGDRGMLMTEEGLFIYDCLIPNGTVESILLYRNVLFINRIALELNSDQEADILFGFLTFLYPQVSSGRENNMEEAVEKLRGLKDEKGSDSGKVYFNKSIQYKEYVAQMVAEYVECYQKLHSRAQYDKYRKEMQRLKILHRVMQGIQVVLLVVLLSKIELWGFLVSGIIYLVYYVIYTVIEMYFEKLLPEEMIKLLHESQLYEGALNLLEYRARIDEMRKQILGADNDNLAVKFCTKCGRPLGKTWINCPYCGDE